VVKINLKLVFMIIEVKDVNKDLLEVF